MVIPNPVDPERPFAWTLFEGRWGQRGVPLFNGPVGPNVDEKWNDPVGSMRIGHPPLFPSLRTPRSASMPPASSARFPKTARAGRHSPPPGLAGRPDRCRRPRLDLLLRLPIWKYLLGALDIYGNELTTFLGIGLLAIPIGFIFNLLVQILARYSPFDQVLGWLSFSGGAAFTAASIVGGLQQAAMLLIVVPAVVQAMKQIRRWRAPHGARQFTEPRSATSAPT